MNRIYAIVTHHKRPDDAAEAWKDCNVCAIGFTDYGKLNKAKPETLCSNARRFLEIKKGSRSLEKKL